MQLRATVAAGGGGGMGDMSRGASRAGDRLPINKQTPISNQEVTDGDTDGGVNRGEGGEDSTAAGGKDSGKQSPNTTTTTATTANPISLDEFLANATEEEISAMEGRKRDRSERELKREVAHATAEGRWRFPHERSYTKKNGPFGVCKVSQHIRSASSQHPYKHTLSIHPAAPHPPPPLPTLTLTHPINPPIHQGPLD